MMLAASSTAFAFGWFPGSWKFADNGHAVRKPPVGMDVAIVQNNGPDTIEVSSKGALETVSGPLLPGQKGAIQIPPGGKNVKLKDGLFDNGKGAKGSLIWVKKLPKTGVIGGGGTGQ